jgi:hypothetical protein
MSTERKVAVITGTFGQGGRRRSMRTLILAACVGLAGCARTPPGAPAAPPVPVTVSHPVEREVTDSAEFTVRTAAVDSVEVRAHTSNDPVIVAPLPPGPHNILIELADTNHNVLAKEVVNFEVPRR